MCQRAGEHGGIPLFNQSGKPIIAWVKYGPNVTMDKVSTQDWVVKNLNTQPEATMWVP